MSANGMDESEHEELAHIPIETLGLSENTISLLKRVGMTNVSDCVDSLRRWGVAEEKVPPGFIQAMDSEVRAKLEELGYWPTSD